MYERMLDKQNKPTEAEFTAHCGDCQDRLAQLDDFLTNELKSEKSLRFPYGNSYGWSLKYFIKRKLICDLFAEKDAFTIMLRLTDAQFEKHYDQLSDYAKRLIDEKYPCGEGGWIHYRVLPSRPLDDIETLLKAKLNLA